MTKLIFCGKCNDIRVVQAQEINGHWTECSCGYMAARWAGDGRLKVKCVDQYPGTTLARVIGMHNQFLYDTFAHFPDYGNNPTDSYSYGAFWRRRQKEILGKTNSYYLFSPSNRDSWAVVIRVGETSDIVWEPNQE